MAGIVTFLLTAVYAQSALLRIREYYLNKGKALVEKVRIVIRARMLKTMHVWIIHCPQDRKKRLRYIVTSISYVISW